MCYSQSLPSCLLIFAHIYRCSYVYAYICNCCVFLLDWSLYCYAMSFFISYKQFLFQSLFCLNIAIPDLFLFPFAQNTFLHRLNFSLLVSLDLIWVSVGTMYMGLGCFLFVVVLFVFSLSHSMSFHWNTESIYISSNYWEAGTYCILQLFSDCFVVLWCYFLLPLLSFLVIW